MVDASAAPVDLIGRSRYALAANGLTVGRLVLAPVLAFMILSEEQRWVTFALALVLGASDFFDGRLARNARPTRFGAFVDPLADKTVVLLAGFSLVAIDRFSIWPWLVIAVREIGIQVYRSYWARRGFAIPARPSAKYKVFVQGVVIAAALWPWLDDARWIADGLLWVAVAFTVVSGVQYLLDGRAALRTGGAR
jgi:CDP-diacylglycerol--glycerol-3-phosphate 3-phosphatidyltransferase